MSGPVPGRWQQLSPYLDQALTLTDAERAEWLEGVRQEDPALAAETARQVRVQLARRVEELELDQAAAQKQWRLFNTELVELAGDGKIQSSERLDRAGAAIAGMSARDASSRRSVVTAGVSSVSSRKISG